MRYEKSLMAKWDEYAILKTAEDRGIEKGIEKGMEKGMEKGIKRGIEKGRREGKIEEVKNLVVKMGLSDTQAAEIAEVPASFVKKVRRTLKK